MERAVVNGGEIEYELRREGEPVLLVHGTHIAGHSSGGTIAQQLAMDHPERVGSLLLLEPALFMVPSGEQFGEKLQPSIDYYEADEPGAAVDSFLTVVAGDRWRELCPESMPGAAEQARADAATFFELEAPGVMAWQVDEAGIDGFDRPVLYLWGGESGTVIGVEEVYREGRDLVKDWFPQAQEHYIEDINHALQMQDPEAVAEGMAEFLQRHPLP
jgi:pimeloyl-ACP methyl ester carboxylesterase